MVFNHVFKSTIFMLLLTLSNCEINESNGGSSCVDLNNQPQICYPPFDNYASAGLRVIATNTCGKRGRQKYCIGLSSAEMRTRCEYCDHKNASERHSADYLTDQIPNNWWQSETLAENKNTITHFSVNLTLDLGNQFHVTFIHLHFKSPRPSSMVIYKKFDNNSPWTPWQYYASNCQRHFNISYVRGQVVNRHDEVLCTEDFSSLNDFYNGVVMFASIYGRPGAEDFFSNRKLMDWATASQIRIELRKMHTFGEQNDEEELLLTYFYAIKSIQVAARCWCNGHGNECRKSTGEGIEPKLYCVCHPSHHTTGQSCEKCDSFYQDRPWQPATALGANICQRCNCNNNSDSCVFNEELYIKSGNQSGGMCVNCRNNTKGPHCEECLEGFYKNPLNPNHCIPCNCDPIGRSSPQCDNKGICRCQPGVGGDKCSQCKIDHFNFGSKGCQPCNCHSPGVNISSQPFCNPSTGMCYCKKNVIGEKCDSCAGGYFGLTASDPLGCRPCFCFAHTKDCAMANGFHLAEIKSEFHQNVDGWKYGVAGQFPEYTPMLNTSTQPPSITWFNGREPWRDNYFFHMPKKFLGNRRLSYNLNLLLTLSFEVSLQYKAFYTELISMTNDVQLISDQLSVMVPFIFGENKPLKVDNDPKVYAFRLNEESGGWRDRLDNYRFQSLLSNLTGIRIRLTNPYGLVRLHKAVLQTAQHVDTVTFSNLNLPTAASVERCSCPPQYTGLSCESCARGHYREYPEGTEFGKCIKCNCNNQSDICDAQTGKCHCSHHTVGDNCETCQNGFYGDPTSQIRGVCRSCECPGQSGCEVVKMVDGDMIVCTDCPDNLGGYRCDRCRDNFYGNPKLNISCQPCECHGSIDDFSSCNSITGKCPNCIYNTAGDYCETCLPGHQLLPNETGMNRCKLCICNPPGSLQNGTICDINTGKCLCSRMVTGDRCDICKPGYFNLTSEQACQPCNCSQVGSSNDDCNKTDGQCLCKPGVTGLHCDRCDRGYFNLTTEGCQKCSCHSEGSGNLQCHLLTGQCDCRPNTVGMKCDTCMANYHNLTSQGCQPCPACYDLIKNRIKLLNDQMSILKGSTRSMNASIHNSWNRSNVFNITSKLNSASEKIYKTFLQNFEKIQNLEKEVARVNLTLSDLDAKVSTFKEHKYAEKLQRIAKDIKNTENHIKSLMDNNFNNSLKALENHINNQNENNEKMTAMAEMAQLYSSKAISQKENVSKILLQSERHINESLSAYAEFIDRYSSYVDNSSKFDKMELVELGKKIQTESAANLKTIENIYKTMDNFENRTSEAENKLMILLNETDQMLLWFGKAETSAQILEKKFKSFLTNLPDLKKLERQINNKSHHMVLKNEVFSEARNMLARLKEAQTNLTNAINKANNTLLRLQDLDKDFNKIVNQSKLEAEEHIKRLPHLKLKLEKIQSEIKVLNKSSSEIITNLTIFRDDLQVLYDETAKLNETLADFTLQVLTLLNSSEADLAFSNKIETLADKRLNDDLSTEKEILEISKEFERLLNESRRHKNFELHLEQAVDLLVKQMLNMKNQSESGNDKKLKYYSQLVESLSRKIEGYFKNEFEIVSKNNEDLDREWDELNKELLLTSKEISRLKLIDEHMVPVDGNICYKSGGKAEGLDS